MKTQNDLDLFREWWNHEDQKQFRIGTSEGWAFRMWLAIQSTLTDNLQEQITRADESDARYETWSRMAAFAFNCQEDNVRELTSALSKAEKVLKEAEPMYLKKTGQGSDWNGSYTEYVTTDEQDHLDNPKTVLKLWGLNNNLKKEIENDAK